ncbi:MAG: histidine phosphatase family protein [Chloroflexi bacterium]|jgi:broad specificity phosphatase PhoE|nr:histidine phosphatase family protein [Chloroflexota bacterium]MBT4074850.1 histidine phosphatase family protein [Chloroflexota bacterium]MBT4514102.1 histidine phosphatase family protein [Chloroflexota bacterium]
MPRLILVRHGETDWNVAGRAQGHLDEPLNERGLAQARLSGQFLRDNFDVKTTWSSDLSRCATTAEGIGVPVQLAQSIREISFGDWEGKKWDEISRVDPVGRERLSAGDPGFRPPGGESMSDVVVRARRFVDETGLLKIDGDVAVVGHGGSLKCLMVVLLGLPESALGRFHFSNCGVSVVGAGNGPGTLLSFNQTAHLAEAAPIT